MARYEVVLPQRAVTDSGSVIRVVRNRPSSQVQVTYWQYARYFFTPPPAVIDVTYKDGISMASGKLYASSMRSTLLPDEEDLPSNGSLVYHGEFEEAFSRGRRPGRLIVDFGGVDNQTSVFLEVA